MANREVEVNRILSKTGALVTDSHIVYTSGRHGTAYINKDAIYPDTLATTDLCEMMADDFRFDQIQTVVGPAYGGIILANNTAAALTRITTRDVAGVFAEKTVDGKGFHFTRGYDRFVSGRRVLVVEDILTTGGSLLATVKLCEAAGAEVVGAAALVNRGGVKPEDAGVKLLRTLLNIDMDSWAEDACQLCADGVPINTVVGKGADFLRRRAALLIDNSKAV